MFSHRLAETQAVMVQLTTAAGAVLVLTPDHYVYVNNGSLAAARTVRVGDVLTLADGRAAAVTAVGTQTAAGLYNPHTLHGDVVVDGVHTSTYTEGVAPALAHAALWPVRALYQAGVPVATADTFAHGAQALVDLLPRGKPRYN